MVVHPSTRNPGATPNDVTSFPGFIGGSEHPGYMRRYYSWSDADYEYLLYRTRGKAKADLRYRSFRHNFLPEPEFANSYNLGKFKYDNRLLLDRDEAVMDVPDFIDSFLTPNVAVAAESRRWLFEKIVSVYFFYKPAFSNPLWSYVLYLYFLASEYVYYVGWLYFPFFSAFVPRNFFGVSGFVDTYSLPLLCSCYLPFFVLFFFQAISSQERVPLTIITLFCTSALFIFLFTYFVSGLVGLFFSVVWYIFVSLLFFIAFPFILRVFRERSLYHYSTFSGIFLDNFPKKSGLFFPIFFFTVSWDKLCPISYVSRKNLFSSRLVEPKKGRFVCGLVNVGSVWAFIERKRFVESHRPNLSLFYSAQKNAQGFVLPSMPGSHGYSAEDQFFVENYPIFTPMENVESPRERYNDPYIMGFMNPSLGVSNLAFFKALGIKTQVDKLDTYDIGPRAPLFLGSDYSIGGINLLDSSNWFYFFKPSLVSYVEKPRIFVERADSSFEGGGLRFVKFIRSCYHVLEVAVDVLSGFRYRDFSTLNQSLTALSLARALFFYSVIFSIPFVSKNVVRSFCRLLTILRIRKEGLTRVHYIFLRFIIKQIQGNLLLRIGFPFGNRSKLVLMRVCIRLIRNL